MIKILLAEDHNIVRDGLRSLINNEADLEVVAEATNGQEVIELLSNQIEPDILLTDLNMPVLGGLELTGMVKSQYPGVRTIVLSALDNEKYVISAFKAGAQGFVLKSVSSSELLFAIRHVVAGNEYVCSELTTKFLSRMLNMPEPAAIDKNGDINFSDREIEVLNLLAEGLTNQEIADKILSSKRTVEGYRENMINRTGVRNTVALIRYAVINGIIS